MEYEITLSNIFLLMIVEGIVCLTIFGYSIYRTLHDERPILATALGASMSSFTFAAFIKLYQPHIIDNLTPDKLSVFKIGAAINLGLFLLSLVLAILAYTN